MRVAIFGDCGGCKPYSGVAFGLTAEEQLKADCAAGNVAPWACEQAGYPYPSGSKVNKEGELTDAQKKSGCASGAYPFTLAECQKWGYPFASAKTSASAQGVSPAPNGDTFEEAAKNYAKQDLINAVAWGEYRDAGGAVSDSARVRASAVVTSALGGDTVSMAAVTRNLGYWYAAGKPVGAPSAVDTIYAEAVAACNTLPTIGGLRDKCLSEAAKARDKGEQAVNNFIENTIPNYLPGGDKDEQKDGNGGTEEKPIPWWAWLAGAGAAALIIKQFVVRRR